MLFPYKRWLRILLIGLIAFTASQREVFPAQLRLSWSDNSDNEEGFEIQRMSPGSGFLSIAIVGANASGFIDHNLSAGSTYCYRLRAFNAEGISGFSNLGCGTTPTTVSVSKFGSGAGSVLSNPPGIDCGADCREPYPVGTFVTLVANPAEGSFFAGWSGAVCAGAGDCLFNVASDLSVTAVFDLANPENVPPPADPPPPPSTPTSPPLTLTGLNADLASPQFIGTTVTFTASAAGGVAPLAFKWWIFDGSVWRVARDWDTSPMFVFSPTEHGAYAIALWARSSGSGSDRPENDAVLVQPFTIIPRSCPAGQFLAEFFANQSLSGNPVFTACDLVIGYSWFWGEGFAGLNGENFSVRWTGRFAFDAGFYNFVATADDGIRVQIDGDRIIDGWIDQAPTSYQSILNMSAGEHVVQVDYYQNGGGALTQFYWHGIVPTNDDHYVMFERENLTVNAPGVLGNDHPIGGNPPSATLISGPANGALVLNPDGSFSYTPNGNFNGTDNFTYRAVSGAVTGNLATVTITVTAINDVPLASNDVYVLTEDANLAVDAPGVLANDNDLDGDQLSAQLVTTTTHGTLNFNPDGSFSYTPNANFNGTDSFTYRVTDGVNESNVAMVTLAVTAFNDIPVAHNDAYETFAGLTVVAPGVLDNDTDADNNPLTAVLVTQPLFGAVALNPDGSFDYLPPANFIGTDSFSYKASDGGAESNVAMVTITVMPPPVVLPPSPTVQVGRAGSGSGSVVSSPAGIACGDDCAEPFAIGAIVTLVANPGEGSLFAGWSGACAGTGACIFNVDGNVSVTALFDAINPENNPPPPPPTPPIPALALTGLVADLVSPQLAGTAVTFTAAAIGGVAPIEFKWWVHDGTDWRMQQDWSANQTLLFAPAQPGAYVIALWGRSAGNTSDAPESDLVLTNAFTFAPLSCPAGQYLAEFFSNMSLAGSPTFSTCQAAIDFNWADGAPGSGIGSDNFSARWMGRFAFSAGIHEFIATADDGIRVWLGGNLIIDGWLDQAATTYRASLDIGAGEHVVQVEYYDNTGDALAQVSWHRVVTGNDDFFVTLENNALVVEAPGVLGNDSGAAPLTATLVSGVANGSLVLNPDGSFSYTPNPNFNGTDSFTYLASDGVNESNVAMVTLAVTALNDTPVAQNDAYEITEGPILSVVAPGVLGNDIDPEGDPMAAILVTQPLFGSLTLNTDGSFEYIPLVNFSGTDSFTYKTTDGGADSNVALVTITVSPPTVP